jgi:hypothetical protein
MIIGIPAYEGVDLLSTWTGPYEMFHWARFEIDVLAASPGLKTSGSGFSFLAHDVPVKTAVGAGQIELDGPRELRQHFERWLGLSVLQQSRMPSLPQRLPAVGADPDGGQALTIRFEMHRPGCHEYRIATG